MLTPILMVWGAGLLLGASLYGAWALMSWYDENRRIARHFRTRRQPYVPVTPPHRNGKAQPGAMKYQRTWPETAGRRS